MINDGGVELMIEFFAYHWVYLSIFLLILFLALFVYIKTKKAKKRKKEMETEAMIDQMSMRRASIDTTYLEKDFFKTIERLIYSFYAQQPQLIPADKLTTELYMEWYNSLKREYELKIRKQLYDFRMIKARVTKQDNSSMYGVSRIEVEGTFKVDYLYSHATLEERVIKEFTHTFVFLNANNSWLLEKVSPEEDVNKQVVNQ